MPDIYSSLLVDLKEIGLLGSVDAVLGWDERTQLPARGAQHRSEQIALLARLRHERFTRPEIGQKLDTLADAARLAKPDSDLAVNVRETRRDYERACKLPGTLVEELARVSVLGQHAWGEARAKSDFAAFAPWLQKILVLKRQEAECVGYADEKYNALLDEFEPGETAAHLRQVFESLRGPLVDLVRRVTSSPRKAPADLLERTFPVEAQAKLAREAATAVGFDFDAGRLDVSLHPFCTGIGPGDTRMTTRYDEKYFGDAFFGVLHETGHALYEQGLPAEHFGTPLGHAVSLGIHESQSRMWENLVGRRRTFWTYFMPRARQAFPDALRDVSEDDWLFAVNDIRPSFIRTEADEATYNLHILMRFELEQALLEGDLDVNDLPAAWNAKMREYLGITPPDDAQGCLQDIHWSGGAIGYFPTYTLGNLYAAQFFERAVEDMGGVDAAFSRGDFGALLEWLRRNIHRHGKRYRAAELVERTTGRPLQVEPLLRHLRRKAEPFGV